MKFKIGVLVLLALNIIGVSSQNCVPRDNKCECGENSLRNKNFSKFFLCFDFCLFIYTSMIHLSLGLSHLHSFLLIILVFEDGTGYNFHDIIKKDSTPNYLKAVSDRNLTFYYHPCGDSLLPDIGENITNNCGSGYTFCMLNITENTSLLLGKNDDMTFELNNGVMQLVFVNPNAQQENLKKSTISLQCTPNSKISDLHVPINLNENQIVR